MDSAISPLKMYPRGLKYCVSPRVASVMAKMFIKFVTSRTVTRIRLRRASKRSSLRAALSPIFRSEILCESARGERDGEDVHQVRHQQNGDENPAAARQQAVKLAGRAIAHFQIGNIV